MPLQQDISVQVHNILHMEEDKLCTLPYILLDYTRDTHKNPMGFVLKPNLAAETPNKCVMLSLILALSIQTLMLLGHT